MRSGSILLVDDDILFRNSLKKILSFEGYDVFEAHSGKEGLLNYDPGKHNIIISDYRLNDDLNGIEMLVNIRKSFPDAMAILITAFFDEDIVSKAKKAGFLNVMSKPLDMEMISSIIKQTLNGKNGLH